MPAMNDGWNDGLQYCAACGLYFDPVVACIACPHTDFKTLAQRARNSLFAELIESQVEEVLKKCRVSGRPGEL